MLPNYRGLLAIIPPAVLRALTSQSAVLRFSRAAILAGPLPVWIVSLSSRSPLTAILSSLSTLLQTL